MKSGFIVRSEFAAGLAAKVSYLSEQDAHDSINYIIALMGSAIAIGKRIEIRGFGSFTLNYRPPRSAHNPRTGERVITAEKHTIHFRPGKELSERVDASRTNPNIKLNAKKAHES